MYTRNASFLILIFNFFIHIHIFLDDLVAYMSILGLAVNVGGGGLVGGEDEHLGNVDVSGAAGDKDDSLGNVVAVQGLDALVHRVGLVLVAAEADHGELGLDET